MAADGPPASADAPPASSIDAPTPKADAPLAAADAAPGTADAPTATGWRAIPLPLNQSEARVTGILCSSRDACVISTDVFGDPGKVMAASDHAVGATLFDGADAAAPAGVVVGSVGFQGIDRTRNGVIARADVSGAYISAAGDFTQAASWSVVEIGSVAGGIFGLNGQEALQESADGEWLFINTDGYVYSAASAPGAATAWTTLWSPNAQPPVPEDFPARYAADPTLCDSDVGTETVPRATQNVYISPDLALVVLPAGGLNQRGTAKPGVCISTDRGKTFFQSPFAGLPDDTDNAGPMAVTCLDVNRCFAFNGLNFGGNAIYVYYTANASMGKASTWTRATLPAGLPSASTIDPRFLFFAPDGMHGWLAGANDGGPMLLRTTDGGHSFTDVTGSVRAVTSERLHSGFALDADHIWVGGENGALLFTDTASH